MHLPLGVLGGQQSLAIGRGKRAVPRSRFLGLFQGFALLFAGAEQFRAKLGQFLLQDRFDRFAQSDV